MFFHAFFSNFYGILPVSFGVFLGFEHVSVFSRFCDFQKIFCRIASIFYMFWG